MTMRALLAGTRVLKEVVSANEIDMQQRLAQTRPM